jgi:hypothetical protein
MRSSLRKTLTLGFALAGVALFPGLVHAQGKAQVEPPVFDSIPSPEVNTGKGKSFKPKDWLEIESKMRIPAQTAEQKQVGFLDSVTVKWYIAIKNHEGRGVWLLSKEIRHINVPIDEEIYSSVYLSPSTLKRVTGSDKAGKMSVERVGIEVLLNGAPIGVQSTKGDPGWWNASTASVSRTDKFPLLNKNETPFKMLWWDRYAEIEEEKR